MNTEDGDVEEVPVVLSPWPDEGSSCSSESRFGIPVDDAADEADALRNSRNKECGDVQFVAAEHTDDVQFAATEHAPDAQF